MPIADAGAKDRHRKQASHWARRVRCADRGSDPERFHRARAGGSSFGVGRGVEQFFGISVHAFTFVRKRATYGTAETLMQQIMARVRSERQAAALEIVLAF